MFFITFLTIYFYLNWSLNSVKITITNMSQFTGIFVESHRRYFKSSRSGGFFFNVCDLWFMMACEILKESLKHIRKVRVWSVIGVSMKMSNNLSVDEILLTLITFFCSHSQYLKIFRVFILWINEVYANVTNLKLN